MCITRDGVLEFCREDAFLFLYFQCVTLRFAD